VSDDDSGGERMNDSYTTTATFDARMCGLKESETLNLEPRKRI
jgi:hypothetical protein